MRDFVFSHIFFCSFISFCKVSYNACISDSNYEKDCKRLNIEKWEKALRIAEIRKEKNCTYEQAEQIYNDEKAKKDMQNN